MAALKVELAAKERRVQELEGSLSAQEGTVAELQLQVAMASTPKGAQCLLKEEQLSTRWLCGVGFMCWFPLHLELVANTLSTDATQ